MSLSKLSFRISNQFVPGSMRTYKCYKRRLKGHRDAAVENSLLKQTVGKMTMSEKMNADCLSSIER